ncbi:MAG: sigma-70 family RNA polymerase sigma factor [Chloroflexi bacterium]|nr:sigma-70 family RNA polymerase sigma factor [Chloroflexota bacterium]
MDEPNLAHAIVRCQAGDKQSFRLIADFHGERLYGIAFLILNDRGRAEDAAQEALLKAWRHIKRFRVRAKLSPWLNRILLNEIKKQGRRARHPEAPIDEAYPLPDTGRSPAQRVLDAELSAHLWDQVRALPQEQRIALVLRYYLGYSTPEIAQSTGWAQGTVRSRLSRGMVTLRQTVDLTLFGDADVKAGKR